MTTNGLVRRRADEGSDQRLYERFTPLVRRIAMKTIRSLPSSVTLDDLLSAGWLGLAEALRRRTPEMDDDHFEAYASHRIQGAILDHLRTLDPLSRRLRGASSRVTDATARLGQRLGREPEEEEIAAELGVTLGEYQQLLTEIAEAGFARLELTDTTALQQEQSSPEGLTSQMELLQAVTSAIEQLPERHQLVLALYYQEDCSLKEIGAVLEVTESRACQLHSEAVHRIRAKLQSPRPAPTPAANAPRAPAQSPFGSLK